MVAWGSMVSNFLGDVGPDRGLTSIISTSELSVREGALFQKSMNFRDRGAALSVFLVLPSATGHFFDAWNPETQEYIFRGHDSVTMRAGGKEDDQLLMYEGGVLSDNGKFYKAAKEYQEGHRPEPLQVQVYEKLSAGAWFDKGIFNLLDAQRARFEGRIHFEFVLTPADAKRHDRNEVRNAERMTSATDKARVWYQCGGRCAKCTHQLGLRFVPTETSPHDALTMTLLCPVHRGERVGGGLLG